jgi:TonB family protein
MSVTPSSDAKVEISVDAAPTGSPAMPAPEYHLTLVDSPLPPVSLFRQIWQGLREPKFTVPKEYYQGKSSADIPGSSAGPEVHFTFVDSPLPPVSLFRQIWQGLHEPKFTVPKEYYQGKSGADVAGSSAGPEYHFTFVDSTLPPVSLFRQIWQGFHEPKFTVPKEYYQGKTSANVLPTGSSAVPGAEFHPTFVDSALPPVSLFRQVLEIVREPKVTGKKGYDLRKATPLAADAPAVFVDPNQLSLFEKPGALPIGSKPIDLPEEWQEYVLLDLDPEAVKWRRRTMYLSSVILHGILVLILVFSPELLRRGRQMVGLPVEVAPKKEYSYLFIPPEVLRRLREPPPENAPLSDRNRRAQGRSPVIDPNGLRMPYSLGNTKLPELAGGKPPAAAPTPPPAGGNTAPASPPSNQPSNQTPSEAKNDGGLRLEDVKPNTGGGSGLNLPNLTPGQAIQQSLQSAARAGRYPSAGGSGSGSGGGYGDGGGNFQNLQPNFSTEGPLILSDTLGVDFGPYLAGLVYRVRKNWYSMIPESARLGEKGRVGIVFEILKDGSVPQLRLVASSGSDPLDRAALASLRASIPFPPLPDEFTGNHLVLEFIFLYNIAPGQ